MREKRIWIQNTIVCLKLILRKSMLPGPLESHQFHCLPSSIRENHYITFGAVNSHNFFLHNFTIYVHIPNYHEYINIYNSLKNTYSMCAYYKLSLGVPVVAQWLMNPTSNHEVVGSTPDLARWVKNLALP